MIESNINGSIDSRASTNNKEDNKSNSRGKSFKSKDSSSRSTFEFVGLEKEPLHKVVPLGGKPVSIKIDLNPDTNLALQRFLAWSYDRFAELWELRLRREVPVTLEEFEQYIVTYYISRLRFVQRKQSGWRNCALRPIIDLADTEHPVPSLLANVANGIGKLESQKHQIYGWPEDILEKNCISRHGDVVEHPYLANEATMFKVARFFTAIQGLGQVMVYGYTKDTHAEEKFLECSIQGNAYVEGLSNTYDTAPMLVRDEFGSVYVTTMEDMHPGLLITASILGLHGIEEVMNLGFLGLSSTDFSRYVSRAIRSTELAERVVSDNQAIYHNG